MSEGLLLSGLDGSNPLAFLAALGTLRTLTIALPSEKVMMNWEQAEGAWRPRVRCSLEGDGGAVVVQLEEELSKARERVSLSIGDNLNLIAADFRLHLIKAVEKPEALLKSVTRIDADFFASFGSEAVVNDNGLMTDTALRTMSGAGHQHFLKFCREIISKTDSGHLRRTLLVAWDYADDGRGTNLRWDPADDRRYALRWGDPSGDPSKTMRGANRLAIEAMPCLPTMPSGKGLATTAFEGKGARDTFFTWPIWNEPIGLDVVQSLLGSISWLKDDPKGAYHLGVAALYTSARITIGKFRNFTPARPAYEIASD